MEGGAVCTQCLQLIDAQSKEAELSRSGGRVQEVQGLVNQESENQESGECAAPLEVAVPFKMRLRTSQIVVRSRNCNIVQIMKNEK